MTDSLKPIDPRDLDAALKQGSAILIDIREPSEHARERIPGARSIPLSKLDDGSWPARIPPGKITVFHCKSGQRTAAQAGRLAAKVDGEARMLAGGIEAWKRSGLPVLFDRSAPIELQRQVQIAAGGLVFLGVLLAATVSPWFMLMSGFVGAGLMFAGITGYCGLARLLSLMPWNRRAGGGDPLTA
ncbi:MAG TPA: rhodanese family protein [Hypericibacter adhaerens]|jgi:rhodanese-related sulfurtransferase|uniref:rhodanese family protein n=1 Tax=Hypericibacter adhaerens TaxID=2602016 RepID=UPI002C56E8AD|nr:rhodanese family protein [Hypericibacter adhaerens]HWA44953.1 rhodanese family protein [Hypericibacter adhaerens]